jgi:[ribosomal protein S5]-alanine N-acetyltransferase
MCFLNEQTLIIKTNSMQIHLRPWMISDTGTLCKYANNAKIAGFMTDAFPHPYAEADAIKFIEMTTANMPRNILAISINDEAIGGIGIHPQHDIYRKNAELGYWLAEPFWGKGIMTKAVRQMTDYVFSNFDINRIFARPFHHNTPSQKVLLNAGFTFEATLKNSIYKNGQYYDEMIFVYHRPQ